MAGETPDALLGVVADDGLGAASAGRRAEEALAGIERRVRYIADQSRRVARALLTGSLRPTGGLALPITDEHALHDAPLTIDLIEQYAAQWFALVPPDPEVVSALQEKIRQRYGEPAPAGGAPAVGKSVEDALLVEMRWVSLARGEGLFRQGDPGDAAYVIVSGRLRVFVEEDGARRQLNEVGRGELVGEMAVLTGQPRSATVEAMRDAELVELSRATFDRFVERHAQGMMSIVRQLILRLQLQAGAPPADSLVVALVPATPDLPLTELASELAAALAASGRTLLIDGARLDAELGEGASQTPRDDPASGRIDAWMAEREHRFDYVLVQADPTPSAWTQRALGQADRVLLFASADATPARLGGEVLGRARAVGVRRDLVVLRRAEAGEPRGTAAWLDAVQPTDHHHLRVGERADVARLARRLTGRAVGVALGGGGARGLAHIGVLRALGEAGVPIDCLAGTSAGAAVGALYALGLTPDEILAGFTRLPRRLAELTLPVSSLVSGNSLWTWLGWFCGDRRIEDLPVPCLPVSVNLSRGGAQAHRRGQLARATMASNSAPGIYPPVEIDGELHVDGGLIENVPAVSVRAAVDDGPVVAVDVMPTTLLRASVGYEPGRAGWRLVADQLSRRAALPGMATIISRAIEVAGSDQERRTPRRAVDLHLTLPVAEFGIADYRRAAAMVEIGYQHAIERIEEWWRRIEA